jgi:hypothetical protein
MRDDNQRTLPGGYAFCCEIVKKTARYCYHIVLACGSTKEIADAGIVAVCEDSSIGKVKTQ